MEYKVKVNGQTDFHIQSDKGKIFLDGKELEIDMATISENKGHVIYLNGSYNTEICEIDRLSKTCVVKVNEREYRLELKDKFDELLHRLGLDTLNTSKINEIKAPMPGLVLKIMVR